MVDGAALPPECGVKGGQVRRPALKAAARLRLNSVSASWLSAKSYAPMMVWRFWNRSPERSSVAKIYPSSFLTLI